MIFRRVCRGAEVAASRLTGVAAYCVYSANKQTNVFLTRQPFRRRGGGVGIQHFGDRETAAWRGVNGGAWRPYAGEEQ